MTYSDKTENKKIFKTTYWGNFSLKNRSDEDLKELDEIVKNRNNFINDYNIKNIVNKRPVKLHEYIKELEQKNKLDHVEIYLTNDDKYLILNSPYDPDEKKVPDMQKIYCLYNGANSYIKIVSKEDIKRKDKNKNKYMTNFYNEHPELKNNKIECDICGLSYLYCNKSKHIKTKLHNYALNNGFKFIHIN